MAYHLWSLIVILFLQSLSQPVSGQVSQESTCGTSGDSSCQFSGGTQPFWPIKSGNLNRSGLSPYRGPKKLTKLWEWEEPRPTDDRGVFHSSPMLDGERNVYIQCTNGHLYKLNRFGSLLWDFKMSGNNPGNVVLFDDVLYTASDDGVAWAISAEKGSEIWSTKVGKWSPADTWSAAISEGIVIVPATPENWNREWHAAMSYEPQNGGEEVVALQASDGKILWKYNHAMRGKATSMNFMPVIVNGSVIFDDMSGALFRVSLKDGSEEWFAPAPNPGTFSTGGIALGPLDLVYVARNERTFSPLDCNGQDGMVRAHDIHNGKVVWTHKWPISMNVGLAVGPLGPGGQVAVIAIAGHNTMIRPYPPPVPESWHVVWYTNLGFLHGMWSAIVEKFFIKDVHTTEVTALDAASGKIIWSLSLSNTFWARPPVGDKLRLSAFFCAPDIAGNPSLDVDGTVFFSWSGGKVLALRDENNDGKIDPTEMSTYDHSFGSNGNTALAPNFAVAPTCNGLIAFAD